MKIKIVEEHNFFLFQDIVYHFILMLKHEFNFPLENVHRDKSYMTRPSLECIYRSWYELLMSKIETFEFNECGKRVINQKTAWIVTTNIAITKSQIARGREGIPKWELEHAKKYKPYFLIEFDLDSDTYIAHLDGEILNAFNEALIFVEAFRNFSKESFINILKRYYTFDETAIEKEIEIICEHYRFDDNSIIDFGNYEILEDET